MRLQLAGPPIPATSVRLRDGDISDGRAWFELRRARIGARTRGASSADLQVTVRRAKDRLRVDLATAKKLDHVRASAHRRAHGARHGHEAAGSGLADHEQRADVELYFEWRQHHDDPAEPAAKARATGDCRRRSPTGSAYGTRNVTRFTTVLPAERTHV